MNTLPSPATRPARSSARIPSSSNPASSTSSPLSIGAVTRPPAPTPRRAAATPGRASPRNVLDRPPSAGASPERPNSRSSLYAALTRETEGKEALMMKLQEREATIVRSREENENLLSALSAAESRITELYEDQARIEDELASRNVVAEKLRAEVRELEKEERDIRKRYNDQTQTFDAERQAFYDSEQHLKSRIQSLTQVRQSQRDAQREKRKPSGETLEHDSDLSPSLSSLTEAGSEDLASESKGGESTSIDEDEPDLETPETIALKLELSTLMTSHNSMQSTLQLLQTQLQDLKRVNKELQEENESYNTLLMERTMSGQYDIRRSAPSSATWPGEGEQADESASNTIRSVPLEAVSELDENETTSMPLELAPDLDNGAAIHPPLPLPLRSSSPDSHRTGRKSSRRAGSTRAASPKGESLADLPVAGPGLDLAAELGRAQNKDGYSDDQSMAPVPAPVVDYKEVEELRNEIKALKDANKALSLYSSKILDKIIGHGGFESILASESEARSPASPSKGKVPPVPTPNSREFLRSTSENSSSSASKFASPPPTRPALETAPLNVSSSNSEPLSKRARRGLSLDWSRVSIWASPGTVKNPQPPSPEKRTPTQASATVGIARKLDGPEDEDEEDRVTRARLNAEMRSLGIEKEHVDEPKLTGSSVSIKSAESAIGNSVDKSITTVSPIVQPASSFKNRFSFLSRSSSSAVASSPALSLNETRSFVSLTSEALQQVEAETSIAAYETRERALADEIIRASATNSSNPSSFTELPSIRPGSSLSERHRRRRNGGAETRSNGSASVKSGASTLFSAGRMSLERPFGGANDDDEDN